MDKKGMFGSTIAVILGLVIVIASQPRIADATVADDLECPLTHCVGAADMMASNLDNLLDDPGLERTPSAQLPSSRAWPEQKGDGQPWRIMNNAGQAHGGNRFLYRAPTNGATTQRWIYNARSFDARPGDLYSLQGWIKSSGGDVAAILQLGIQWVNASGTQVNTSRVQNAQTGGSWKGSTLTATAPAGSVAGRAFIYVSQCCLSWYVDDLFLSMVTPVVTAKLGQLSAAINTLSNSTTVRFGGLASLGVFNASTNPLEWTKLKNVPALQSPVTSQCPAGSAISSLSQTGTVKCMLGADAYYAYADASKYVGSGATDDLTDAYLDLEMPPGVWAIYAKVNVRQTAYSPTFVECTLRASGDVFDDDDTDTAILQAPAPPTMSSTPLAGATLSLQIVRVQVKDGFDVGLECVNHDQGFPNAEAMKITAVRLTGEHRFAN
jgi:hypothetical protein